MFHVKHLFVFNFSAPSFSHLVSKHPPTGGCLLYCGLSFHSISKDTHAFASSAACAPVVLTLRFASGSPPRCGASSFPCKVLRPCRNPKRKSALTALSSLAYASMPASSSLSSSGFPPPKSPTEFLRGRNGIRGSAERQAGWRLSTRCAMSGGIYARKNCMCSCQTKVITEKHGGSCRGAD